MSKDIDFIDESGQHWTHTHRYTKCREELALITTERDALLADNARLRELLKRWAFTHTDDESAFMEVHDALAKVRKP